MSFTNILVTGFGPFGDHSVNASWESVKLLPDQINGYKIIKEEIPVCYRTIDNKIPDLWKQHNPILVAHVGVSRFADKITLEKCAFKSGYLKEDVFNNLPLNGNECSANCFENIIDVGINVDAICNHLNGTEDIKACVSENAGRYLCEYILYTSLSIDKNKAIFIHVPVLDSPYTAQELSNGILNILKYILQDLNS